MQRGCSIIENYNKFLLKDFLRRDFWEILWEFLNTYKTMWAKHMILLGCHVYNGWIEGNLQQTTRKRLVTRWQHH